MALPNKQIGWSNEANLLWEVAKQTEALLKVISAFGGGGGGGLQPGDNISLLNNNLGFLNNTFRNSLQQVLDYNHDLVDDNNFQGTSAGDSNLGTNVNAFGNQAGIGNSGSYVNSFGYLTGNFNSGDSVNFMGGNSGSNNTGIVVNAFGASAAYNNSGNYVNFFGLGSITTPNTHSFVNLFGYNPIASGDFQNVYSKSDTISMIHDFSLLTSNKKINYQDRDGIACVINTGDNYVNDAAAAIGGIDVGGLYHTSGAVKIRLT